jgi:K+-transporting ATPase ATPase C chain
LRELLLALRFTAVTMLLLGGGYHAAICGLGALAFPFQANGSLIRRADGTLVGSHLLAQAFTADAYFHPRPSAVHYDAASSGGSNLAWSNPALQSEVEARAAAVRGREGDRGGPIPADLVTASGSGLDPHISPDAARLQVPRVSRARGLEANRVRRLVETHIEPPLLGVFGQPRVNVLELNLVLDAAFGEPRADARPAPGAPALARHRARE